MTLDLKHAKTNTVTDWTQAQLDAQIALGNFPAGKLLADIVLPSDWNDQHTLTGTKTDFNTALTDGDFLFVGGEASINHNSLANLTTGDPHTQYALISGGRNVTVSTTAPVSPSTGDLWVDTN